MASVIEHLASSLNQRNEEPNIELAKTIVAKKDSGAIEELIAHLGSKKVQNDCIKVLYEIGELNPQLIAKHTSDFVALLTSKNNRLQWGGMTALYCISKINPVEIHQALIPIIAAADSGSVITKDYAVNILIELCSKKEFAENSFSLLLEQLVSSPTNQLPMYAEKSWPIINKENKERFVEILTARLPEIEKESKRKRVEKVLKRV